MVFGGYNGCFHNDLHFVDVMRVEKMRVRKASLQSDLAALCGSKLYADTVIRLGEESPIYIHKGPVLHHCTKSEVHGSALLKAIAARHSDPGTQMTTVLFDSLYPGVNRDRRTIRLMLEYLYTAPQLLEVLRGLP